MFGGGAAIRWNEAGGSMRQQPGRGLLDPNKLLEKLKTIIIPAVQFFESPLPEVALELQRQAQQLNSKTPQSTLIYKRS